MTIDLHWSTDVGLAVCCASLLPQSVNQGWVAFWGAKSPYFWWLSRPYCQALWMNIFCSNHFVAYVHHYQPQRIILGELSSPISHPWLQRELSSPNETFTKHQPFSDLLCPCRICKAVSKRPGIANHQNCPAFIKNPITGALAVWKKWHPPRRSSE